MPTFTGTKQQFKCYIGPRLRNLVQKITKKHKTRVAACQHCGAGKDLEAAHIQGRDRNQIIDLLIAARSFAHVVSIDLEKFEADFRKEHEPVEKAILILCRKCHVKYDSGSHSVPSNGAMNTATETMASRASALGILPITLEPPQLAEFQRQLLAHRRAEIVIYYGDGRIERRPWDAPKFSESSNVMGNLRSRPEFRPGVWQAAGVVKVHVSVKTSDA